MKTAERPDYGDDLDYDYRGNGYGEDPARYSDVFAYGNDGRGNRVGVIESDPDYPGDGFAYLYLPRDYPEPTRGYLRVRLAFGAKYIRYLRPITEADFPGYLD